MIVKLFSVAIRIEDLRLKSEEGAGIIKDGKWVTPHDLDGVEVIDEHLYLVDVSLLYGRMDFQIISFATGKPAELSFDDEGASPGSVTESQPATSAPNELFTDSDESGKMKGSVLIMDFTDRSGLEAYLSGEPYVLDGV